MEWPGRKIKINQKFQTVFASKTPEHKRTILIPADRSSIYGYFYFVILFCIFVLQIFRRLSVSFVQGSLESNLICVNKLR